MVERILLVEDDPRLAEMLSEYLGQAGFHITVAALGAAALERLSSAQFDAIAGHMMTQLGYAGRDEYVVNY